MKITWENIEGMYISRRGNLRRVYILITKVSVLPVVK